jgi:hypothetical protein
MPENLNHHEVTDLEPVEPPFYDETSPLTYGALLDDPDINKHAGLKSYVEQWAAQEVSKSGLVYDALPRGDLRPKPGTPEFEAETEGWGMSVDAMTHELLKCLDGDADSWQARTFIRNLSGPEAKELFAKEDEYSAKQLAGLLSAAVRVQEAGAKSQLEKEDMISNPPDYGDIRKAIRGMPADKLELMYFSEDKSHDLRKVLAGMNRLNFIDTLYTLQKIYHCETPLDLFAKDSASARDPIVEMIRRDPNVASIMAGHLTDPEGWPKDMKPEDESRQKRDYAHRFLAEMAGIPETLRNDIWFAAYSRTSNPDTGHADSLNLQVVAEAVAFRVDKLGIDTVMKLREKAGIINIDYYSVDQLRLMSRLIDGDEKAIQHLQAGDVTVVFNDAKTDWNGAIRENSNLYATESGRTLFFEINDVEDFDSYRELLVKLGVKPSTMVLATHGKPGKITFGGVSEYNEYPESIATTTLTRAIARFANEAMQDSRGIDDNREAKGRRRIIMHSCSKGVPVETWRTPERTKKLWRRNNQLDHPEMVKSEESSAETLLRTIANRKLDMYAADAVTGFEATEHGIKMHEFLDEKSKVSKPMDATRLRLDRRGRFIERHVKEVVLRRAKKTGLGKG